MENVPLRIGISMRTGNAIGYDEKRDTIARDWSGYLQNLLPESQYLYLPNIGDNIIEYIEKWGINRLILTGGEDFGSDDLRDQTELCLYQYAVDHNIPLLGICRGFQIICKMKGLQLKKSEQIAINHTATHHSVQFLDKDFFVNSYHSNHIDEMETAKNIFRNIGIASDNTLEALRDKNIMGLMWHPERPNNDQKIIDNLIKNFFYGTE